MKAKVLGYKKIDFAGSNGQVKMTKYHLAFPSSDVDKGEAVNTLSFNEADGAKAPAVDVGGTLEVQYNSKGKLELI